VRAIVVGGGAYGLACAERMARGGASVELLEQDEPAGPRAASSGRTRVLRFEYGDRAIFSELTARARDRWRELERWSGERLFDARGVLHLASPGGPFEERSLEVVRSLGIAIEKLPRSEIARRWPAFALDGVEFGLWSPEGGLLWARRSTAVLARAAVAAGVVVRPRVRVVAASDGAVELADGTRVAGDVVVLCTGSWSSALDERLAAVVPRRQVTAYFRAPLTDVPVFGDGGLDFYGFPAHDGHGVKIGWHRTENAEIADPSAVAPRRVRAEDIEPLAQYLARRFPSAAGAPLVEADVCFYAMTADEQPVIDRLDDRTLVACGLSGHGYKFSCVLGAIVGELALGIEPSVDLTGFALGRPALAAALP
jgi:glycine/D-amino acid oxidase-like deaminating enzyme